MSWQSKRKRCGRRHWKTALLLTHSSIQATPTSLISPSSQTHFEGDNWEARKPSPPLRHGSVEKVCSWLAVGEEDASTTEAACPPFTRQGAAVMSKTEELLLGTKCLERTFFLLDKKPKYMFRMAWMPVLWGLALYLTCILKVKHRYIVKLTGLQELFNILFLCFMIYFGPFCIYYIKQCRLETPKRVRVMKCRKWSGANCDWPLQMSTRVKRLTCMKGSAGSRSCISSDAAQRCFSALKSRCSALMGGASNTQRGRYTLNVLQLLTLMLDCEPAVGGAAPTFRVGVFSS